MVHTDLLSYVKLKGQILLSNKYGQASKVPFRLALLPVAMRRKFYTISEDPTKTSGLEKANY